MLSYIFVNLTFHRFEVFYEKNKTTHPALFKPITCNSQLVFGVEYFKALSATSRYSPLPTIMLSKRQIKQLYEIIYFSLEV